MRKQWHLACVIGALLGAACGDGGDSSGPNGKSDSELKREARESALPPGADTADDPCRANDWHGDGECDAWCPNGDPDDCDASGDEPVACALFFTEPDGLCDRNDPCGPVQDADCQSPDGDDDQVACIEIQFPTNGKCEPAAGCEYTDAEDCGDDGLICPAIWSPADGKCDETDPCGPATDEDCQNAGGDPGDGVVCIAIVYETNGKCEAAPGCESSDAEDCGGADSSPANGGSEGVICTAIYREKDGKCPANDPCDPDC